MQYANALNPWESKAEGVYKLKGEKSMQPKVNNFLSYRLKHLVKITRLEKLINFMPWDHLIPKEELDADAAAAINKLGGGIYRMYDGDGNIIYVGKSNNIHRRLLEHMGSRTNSAYFIDQVARIEWHSDNNPIWQTLLEGIFIAYHMPKYNDEVKDFYKQLEENK